MSQEENIPAQEHLDGKIMERRGSSGELGILQQLDATPVPE